MGTVYSQLSWKEQIILYSSSLFFPQSLKIQRFTSSLFRLRSFHLSKWSSWTRPALTWSQPLLHVAHISLGSNHTVLSCSEPEDTGPPPRPQLGWLPRLHPQQMGSSRLTPWLSQVQSDASPPWPLSCRLRYQTSGWCCWRPSHQLGSIRPVVVSVLVKMLKTFDWTSCFVCHQNYNNRRNPGFREYYCLG